MNIRRYTINDNNSVWDLHNRALNAVGAHGGNGKWDDDLKNIDNIYIKMGGEFLIMEEDNKIIGMGALLRKSRDIGEIKRMRIEPKLQGHGLGSMLLTRLLEIGKECGIKKFVLDTTIQQLSAQRLYEKFGFVKVKTALVGKYEVLFYEKDVG